MRWRLIPVLGVMAVFGLILAHFFRLWNGPQAMTEVPYYGAVLGVVYALILFLLAASSLPDEVPKEGWTWSVVSRQPSLSVRPGDGAAALGARADDPTTSSPTTYCATTRSPPADLFTAVRFGLAALVTLSLMRWANRWLHLVALAGLLAVIHFGYGIWSIHYPPQPPPAKPAAALTTRPAIAIASAIAFASARPRLAWQPDHS